MTRRNTILTSNAAFCLLLFSACANGPTQEQAAAAADTVPMVVKPAPIDGPQVINTQDGGRMEGLIRNGKRHGQWASYFAHGGIRSRITYIDGVEEGPTEVFHESGLTYYSGRYHKGKNTGLWVFYDPDGKELKRAEYDSLGVLVK